MQFYLIILLSTLVTIGTPCLAQGQKLQPPSKQPSQSPLEITAPQVLTPTPAYTTTTPTPLRQPPTPADVQASEQLEKVVTEATINSGAIIVDPEQVVVKPPLLSALIRLDRRLSPLELDATSREEVGLHDVLTAAITGNLTIKISHAGMEEKKWNYYGALGQFLPTLTNGIDYSGISGNYVSPAGLVVPIKNPYLTTQSNFTQYLFKGGSILYGALENKHQYKASQYFVKGTINDTLLDTTKLYYNLAYNDVMLQIRVKAVEVAQGVAIVQQDLYDNGVNTYYDVLESKYELSNDRQKLIAQQVARRQAAINLATALNANTDVDLFLRDRQVSKMRLISSDLTVAYLLKIAVESRPDLKRLNQLVLAAKDQVKVARAALLPVVTGTGTIIGSASNATTEQQLSSSSQTTPLSSSGVGIGPITSASSVALGSSTSGQRHWTMRPLFEIGVDMTYTLPGTGVPEMSQVESARWQVRKTQLEFNRTLAHVYAEVRDAYLSSLSAENLIAETTDAVRFTEEGLRIAVIRLKDGVGTYLELMRAQRNYTDALINKANAIIQFNVAQAELLHAVGRMTVDTLTASVPLRQ